MTGRKILIGLGIAAALAFAISALMVWRVTEIESAPADVAQRRFLAVRDSLELGEPILRLESGTWQRRTVPDVTPDAAFQSVHVLAYRARERKLVHVTIPFWFLRMKEPAVRFLLRDTGVDLDRLGLAPAELARYGPSLVIEEERAQGDRVLIWTQ